MKPISNMSHVVKGGKLLALLRSSPLMRLADCLADNKKGPTELTAKPLKSMVPPHGLEPRTY